MPAGGEGGRDCGCAEAARAPLELDGGSLVDSGGGGDIWPAGDGRGWRWRVCRSVGRACTRKTRMGERERRDKEIRDGRVGEKEEITRERCVWALGSIFDG